MLLPYVMFTKFIIDTHHKTLIESCLFVVRFICNWVTTTIILFGSQWDVERYQRFFDEVNACDRRLDRLDDLRTSAALRTPDAVGQQWWLVLLAVFYSVFFLFDLAAYDWQLSISMWSMIAYVLPSMTASCLLLQFSVSMHMLERRFARIAELVERQLIEQFDVEDAQQRRTMIPLTPQILAIHRRQASGKYKRNNPAAVLDAVRLENIELTAMHNRLIDGFALAVIGIVITSILDLTVQVYLFYKYSVEEEPLNVLETVYAALWSVLLAGRIFIAVAQCDGVTRRRRQIAPAMFQVELNGTLIRADIDRMIDRFALQLLHDVRDQRRLAGGVMPLNVQLMASLVGALTVYLVILIQFDAGERNVA